jgi:hypothetical protein
MPDINVQESINLPPGPAFSAVREIIDEIAGDRGRMRNFALHIDLRDLSMPDVGYVAIPVRLKADAVRDANPTAIPVRIEAKKLPDTFPTFTGEVGIDGTGPSSSTLWLAGSYHLPSDDLSAFITRPMIERIAETTLRNFVDDLSHAVQRKGEHDEIEAVRYRLMGGSS